MTSRKREYREFLKSDFWKKLSSEKRRLVGRCEQCRSTNGLQSHHVRYPDNWHDSTLEDLKVLCRKCHAKEHGITLLETPFIIHRDDIRFSAFLYRCHCLIQKMIEGRGDLRDRDEKFLKKAERIYPPKKKDSCMAFHVNQVRQWHERFKTS